MTVRLSFWTLFCVAALAAAAGAPRAAEATSTRERPNVVLILADDQGYGDLGFHGNPRIRTPHLDQLARESVRCQAFYVSPVCAPTRASLMTGRYNYRTGAVDTYLGRALMHPEEVTLAEMLAGAGYRTGIFGKWHLGDNYPMRPMDQGFQESLVLKGGGIGQPSDPPGGSSYFDPILQHNGKPIKTKGYCSDVFTDAAVRFISENRGRSYFVYLAFNAPHTPLQVPESYFELYKKVSLTRGDFPQIGHPLPREIDRDTTAKVYGMVSNIDDNVGRLLAQLDALGLAANTIVLFLTDNGPQQIRFNGGLLDRKGSVHEGGIRVPFFIRWPAQLAAGRSVDRIAAHIDVAPTLLEACGVPKPKGATFDGRSLLPLLRGEKTDWPDRTLYLQWHRGDAPELFRAFAARTQSYKLVQPLGAQNRMPEHSVLKLYDMANDPFELHDIAAEHADIVERMRQGYVNWFNDVSSTRGYAPSRIFLGATNENPVTLTRQDWRGPRAGWEANSLGYWEVRVATSGVYQVRILYAALPGAATIHFALGGVTRQKEMPAGSTECQFSEVPLELGPGRLEAWISREKETVGARYVEVQRLR